jgi:hypothetical protein
VTRESHNKSHKKQDSFFRVHFPTCSTVTGDGLEKRIIPFESCLKEDSWDPLVILLVLQIQVLILDLSMIL